MIQTTMYIILIEPRNGLSWFQFSCLDMGSRGLTQMLQIVPSEGPLIKMMHAQVQDYIAKQQKATDKQAFVKDSGPIHNAAWCRVLKACHALYADRPSDSHLSSANPGVRLVVHSH